MAAVKQRVGGRAPDLITADEAPAYETAIASTFSEPVPPTPERRSGRPRIAPDRRLCERSRYLRGNAPQYLRAIVQAGDVVPPKAVPALL